MFIVSMETTGYKIVIDQSLTLYAIYKHSPSGYALRSHAYILHIQTSGVVNNYYIRTIIIMTQVFILAR